MDGQTTGGQDPELDASSGRTAFLSAIAAAVIFMPSLLTFVFFEVVSRIVPNDSPGLAVLLFYLGPFVSIVLGAAALGLGLGCVLLRGGRAYAASAVVIGASVVVLAVFFTPMTRQLLGLTI